MIHVAHQIFLTKRIVALYWQTQGEVQGAGTLL